MAFTFFFRDRHTLEHFANQLLPIVADSGRIKIWDAGCAMGPEPYTFAIIFAEALGKAAFQRVSILASDIDETSNFKEIVQNGVYPLSELSRMPEDILENYFVQEGDTTHYKIDEKIRNSVNFQQHDLLSLKPLDTGYHGIICKNVLLHFHPDQRIEVMKMYHQVLLPGGFFVTEQTQAMPAELQNLFEKVVPDANVYRKIG